MRIGAALGVLAAIGALIALSVWSGARESRVRTVTAVSVVGDRIYIGVGGEVWFTDHAGRVLGKFTNPDGARWTGGTVTSVEAGPDGTLLVAADELHQLLQFDAAGRQLGVVKLPFEPRLRFYGAWAGDRYVIADTMGNRLATVDRSGVLLASRNVRYPNSLAYVDASPPKLLLVGTYKRQAFALDPSLGSVEDARIAKLNAMLQVGGGPLRSQHLLGMSRGRGGELVASLCRTTEGDCTFYRVGSSADGPIGDTGAIARSESLDPDEMMAIGTAIAPDGALLIASARAGAVLSFSDGRGGPAPAGFCARCTEEELRARARPLEALRDGFDWPGGTRVARFGDADLLARYDALNGEVARYRILGSLARGGLYLILALLLAAMLVARSFGVHLGAPVPAHAREIWARLIAAGTSELSGALALFVAALAVLASVGGALFGWTGALVAAAVGGLLLSRLKLTPRVVHGASAERARAAWEIFHGPGGPRALLLGEGEAVEHCAFALPLLSRAEVAGELAAAPIVEDPLELLALVFPTPLLFVQTNRRLFLSRVTPWGTPVGELVSLEIVEARGGPAGFAVVRQPGGTASFEVSEKAAFPGAVFAAAAPHRHCAVCGAVDHRCAHRPLSLAAALAAGAVFPGFGQLALRRFSAGRAFAFAGLGMLAATLHAYLPQRWGILPWNPAAIVTPALLLALIWLAAMLELGASARLERRRRACYRGS